MKIVLLLCLLVMMLCMPKKSYTQDNNRDFVQQIIPPSPQGGELAKYITYPVDLSNGLVKISIPLYEIVDGDIIIPITLDYHASGVKPNIRSTDWVGDGWTLNTGPHISRQINGGPDEYYYYDMIEDENPTLQQRELVANQIKDITHDEFYYTLLNTSGRLYFKRIANDVVRPVTIPEDPIKVSLPEANNYRQYINISDKQGLQYSFGGDNLKYRNRTDMDYGTTHISVVTGWKIKEIFSPMTNSTVNFDYFHPQTEVLIYRMMDHVTMIDQLEGCLCKYGFPTIQVCNALGYTYYEYNSVLHGLEPVNPVNLFIPAEYRFPEQSDASIIMHNSYVKEIRFGGGYVTFSKNEAGLKGLTSIRVYDNNEVLVKCIEFEQDTFGTPTILTLRGITISSIDNTDVEKYTFLYENGVLIDKETRSIDQWGYYNGADNITLVPTISTTSILENYPLPSYPIAFDIPGGNRETNESYMKIGVLTGIVYPTGGRSKFVYEAHRYADSGLTKLAGGLRIKQVQQVNTTGDILYHNYRYSTVSHVIDGKGIANVIRTGALSSSEDSFYSYTENDYIVDYLTYYYFFKERRWAENSLIDLYSESGSSVSYPFVTETISSDVSGNNILGKTLYHFDVVPSYPFKLGNTNIILDSKDGWRNGKLMSETVYRGSGISSIDTLSQENYSYDLKYNFGDPDSNRIRQYYVFRVNQVLGPGAQSYVNRFKRVDFSFKDLSTGYRRVSRKTKNTYTNFGDAKMVEDIWYEYDDFGNTNKMKKSNSGASGEKEITTIHYTKDMVDLGKDPTGVFSEMVSDNIIGVPIETMTYKDSIKSENLLNADILKYGKFNDVFYSPIEIINKNSKEASEVKTTIISYDSFGNPQEVINPNLIHTVYLWGYGGEYPIATIDNATYTSVLGVLGLLTINNLNATNVSDVAINNAVNLLRTASSLSQSQVNSYTYSPLLGMTSHTDSSGRTVYYDYDGFGRLQAVRDQDGHLVEDYRYHYRTSNP